MTDPGAGTAAENRGEGPGEPVWIVAPEDRDAVRRLSAGGIPEPIARILASRGFDDAAAREFLSPSLDRTPDPFAMKGMEAAVGALVSAARRGERIVIFGDYDVDGVTAVAQLRAVFRALGADAVPFLPHRVRDGYGLKPETFRKVFAEHRPRAIVTVDCGITAVEAVAEAARAGVAVVITDHHLPPDVLPDGAAVVNPKQPGCGYPFKDLCGSGVAFKIAQAIIRREGLSLSERSLAKVAALGTIADIVPLLAENRAIVAEGLAALADPRAPGLKALLAEAGIEGRAPTSEEIAFRVGPRLNAAGRLDTADLALSVFEEREPVRAAEIARALSERNAERQGHERRVVAEARRRVLDSGEAPDGIVIEADAAWPRGVLGIAASRLAREFRCPVFLFAVDGDRAVGSGRSIPGLSMHEVLSEMRDHLLEFGGHAQACGGAVEAGRFTGFRERARAVFRERLASVDRRPVVRIDAELPLEGADERLVTGLARLEPHGEGNPRPVFLARGLRARERRPVGERGTRCLVSSGGATRKAIAWGLSARDEGLADAPFDAAFHVRRDGWSGGVELEIVGIRPARA
jgi:single-stranded-DNA-specific exonuclease